VRVRTAIADPGSALARRMPNDLDYLAVCLHGRRSRMAEAGRLEELSRLGNLQEFVHAIFPKVDLKEASDFQCHAVNELIRELSGFPAHVTGPAAELLKWVLVRFQVENLKVLIRFCITKRPVADPEQYLVTLPKDLTLPVHALAAAESLPDFVKLVPKGLVRENLESAREIYGDHPHPFFPEGAMDQAYLQELIERAGRLGWEDREIVRPMVCQEVDIFHLMLVIRGKFHYGVTPEMLLPLHVAGARISRSLFSRMLADSDLPTSMDRVAGSVLDATPSGGAPGDEGAITAVDGATLVHLAWKRFLRLANLAFRRSHMGMGAVLGYTGLRRMEVANLTTVSEGIERGIDAGTIRTHLISAVDSEAAHV
jgi:V/A-type H+/Na+-transporting ATPase subunit C